MSVWPHMRASRATTRARGGPAGKAEDARMVRGVWEARHAPEWMRGVLGSNEDQVGVR